MTQCFQDESTILILTITHRDSCHSIGFYCGVVFRSLRNNKSGFANLDHFELSNVLFYGLILLIPRFETYFSAHSLTAKTLRGNVFRFNSIYIIPVQTLT